MKFRWLFLFLPFFMVCGSISCQAAGGPADGPGTVAYKMGDVEIIAIRDTVSERSRGVLLGDAERIAQLMPDEKGIGSGNAYAIKTKTSIILVDTGWGSPRGKMLENLKNIGITPDQIDTILLTHLHGDHVSGMLNKGQSVFPKADIFLSSAERDYWFNDAEMNKNADKTRFNIARQAILAYGDRVKTFEPGVEILPGITAIDEAGHTAGHVGFLIEAKDQKILIWGDLTHFTEVQMAAPDIAVSYDSEPTQAIASRQAILAWVAKERMPVAGMHILFPGVGRVHALDNNSYVFEALDTLGRVFKL